MLSSDGPMYELTGVAFSHYVEKARWALDRFAVPYHDHRVLPLFHMWFVWRLHRGRSGQADRASSRFSTPVLKTPSGKLICDSGEIVKYVSDTYAPPGEDLDPGPEGEEIERRLHDRLGPHTRRVAYAALFERPALIRRIAKENVSRAQASVFGALVPIAGLAMNRILDISPDATQRSIDVVRTELDWISDHLEDGRPWLMGDRFTSVDLSYACMVAPAILPPEYSAWLPSVDDLSERFIAPVREIQAHPAGQFASRLFDRERRRVVVVNTH